MIMNLEQLSQKRQMNRSEQSSAAATRRAEAMSRYSEEAMKQGPNAQPRVDFDWPGHVKPRSNPEAHGLPPQLLLEDERAGYLQDRPIKLQAGHADWLRALGIVKKHWRLSVAFAVVVVGTVTGITLMMNPVFEPEARVEVDPQGAEVFSLDGNKNSGAATDYMETQAQNLQNDELTLEVIRKLHLDQSPYFGAGPNAISSVAKTPSDTAVPLSPAENRALYVFKESRKVTRDAASRLITVSVAAPDPVTAADVTNTLVAMFIERDYKLRNEAIAQSSQWLQRQLEDIRQRMNESNSALNRFQAAHGISAIGDNQDRFTDQMVELTRQLMQAQADRIQLQSYLSSVNGGQDSSLPQISSNPVVQELTKRLAEVKGSLAETRAIYGGSHPNTKKLQSQADELESQLKAQRAEILRDLKTSYTATQAREQLTQSQVQGATRQMTVLAQYNALKKESDASTQLYQVLYQKIKEAAIAAETKSSNIRVVDRARVLDRPTRPHRSRNVEIGLLVGLMGGVVLGFLREAADTRVRTAEDVKRCLPGGSVSIVPLIGDGELMPLPRPWYRLASHSVQGGTPLIQITRPNSPEAEALRSICLSLRLSRQNASTPQVLLVVSPLVGEGKTTLSVNLALTLAQHGTTCIVDSDLRKGRVARALRVDAAHGIRDVLADRMKLDQVLVPAAKMPNLSLLAPGSAPGEPGELLSSGAMLDLLANLRQRFESVVIDSPPMLLFSDGRALSTLADGIIVVGRAGVTTRANLKRTMELLAGVRSAPVIEVVLNAAEYSASDYGYYGEYGMAGGTVN
jgi:capsular exopolysaccharide synthesis family protein